MLSISWIKAFRVFAVFLYVAVVGFKSYSMHDGFMLAIPEKGCEEQTELQ